MDLKHTIQKFGLEVREKNLKRALLDACLCRIIEQREQRKMYIQEELEDGHTIRRMEWCPFCLCCFLWPILWLAPLILARKIKEDIKWLAVVALIKVDWCVPSSKVLCGHASLYFICATWHRHIWIVPVSRTCLCKNNKHNNKRKFALKIIWNPFGL